MADNLNGIRKEYWNTASFRMVLKEAIGNRPAPLPFDESREVDEQVEKWKSLCAQQKGFDAAFQFITGHNIEDLNNE